MKKILKTLFITIAAIVLISVIYNVYTGYSMYREAVNKYGKSIVLENDEEKIYDGLKQIIKDKKLSEKITQDCMYDNSKIIDKIVKLVGE